MQIINIVTIILFGLNIIMPFILTGLPTHSLLISNSSGWGIAIVWFLFSTRQVRKL